MPKILRMVGLIPAIVLGGTALYVLVEHVSFVDGLYFALATVTTVGYGDIVPLTRAGQVVAMCLMIGGVGAAFYILTSVMSFVVEGRLTQVMGVRKMMKTIEQMQGHYIICGYGRLGRQVVRELEANGADYVILESNPDRAAECREGGHPVIEGDAAKEEVLRQAGLDRCAGVATTISDDAENIYIGLTARSLRPEVPVVCRSSSTRVRPLFERAGIHRIISTEEIGARRLVSSLMRPHIVEFLDELMRHEKGLPALHAVHLETGSTLVGQTLESARLRNEYDVVVLAIQRPDGPVLPNPGPRERLQAEDMLILIGKPEQVERMRALVEATPPAGAPEPA